ncbi:MAG TPA: class I tRNA ligase family protein [Candidatus Nanoarchaeia archaeon]|nr:class I tRNA ligase family protein [Candidatus Nanoarchaeia archaeon]
MAQRKNQSSYAKASAPAKATADKPEDKKNIFVGMEEEVLAFWRKNRIFEKSVNKEAPLRQAQGRRGEYVFYDGPPFATGTPHYGHLVASLMKDAVPRFWTMNGYEVRRRWGWDCHGLPIENIVEKELGTKSKKEIEEKIGVEKFNALCRSKVLSYADEWQKIVTRLGRWVDMDHPYRTMDIDYMESIWWAFKQLWDADLIYKDYRSMYICPRCETTLSDSEVAEGYKDVKDLSVTVKFELVDPSYAKASEGKLASAEAVEDKSKTYILAWTTTPWTLPGNVALAIGNDIDYIELQITNDKLQIENYILAKERAIKIFEGKDYKTIKEFKGSELVGKKYRPLFDYYAKDEKLANRENGWKIYHGDFVTTEDGTGVVHIAPAFGEDDMKLGRDYNLPFIQHVAMDGTFKPEMGEFAGLHVKPKDDVQATDVAIIKYLAAKNLLFSKEKFEHSYPFCWRCDTPLINYATSSWFVKITQMKPRMIELAEAINWSPEHIKKGRFGNWLEGARDWSISRQRFWASCLPIWECACGAKKVLGSLEELYQHADGQLTKLILIRHGEAENNAANIIYSGPDKYHLTVKGREQVAAGIEEIKKEIPADKNKIAFFTSPLLRTKDTAEMIGQAFGIEPVIAEELREIGLGSWNDKNRDDLFAQDELRRQYLSAKPEEVMDIRVGGTGETQTEVGERMRQWLLKILSENKGKTILIVSHSDPIDDLVSVLRGRSKHEAGFSLYGPNHTSIGKHKIVYLNNATQKEIDLHKDSVDKIILKCDICGENMKRVPDVLDTWFDSGSMPYAQMHYPFENKERFEQNFPAEFIAEGVDQTRAWFYYLHVMAVGIKNNFAYKNVIVNGIVLAEDGKKMSKRLQNYPDPEFIFDKYGADALRYYLLTSPVMTAENLNFSEKGVAEALRKVNMILWNVYKFYEMYCHSERSVSGVEEPLKDSDFGKVKGSLADARDDRRKNILDKWIIARLNRLVVEVTDGMKKYDLPRATRPIVAFIDDFSTWYLRRSRDRFKPSYAEASEGKDDKSPLSRGVAEGRGVFNNDKKAALATTRLVLTDLAKIMAPFTPFIAEELWQKVTGNNFSNPEMSVHLEEWPSFAKATEGKPALAKDLESKDKKSPLERGGQSLTGRGVSKSEDTEEAGIIQEMALARRVVELGLARRDEAGIKVRQPLIELRIKNYELRDEIAELIKDELNVKKVSSTVGEGDLSVELDTAMTPELVAEGLKRELVRFINAERKNAGLTISDRIKLEINTASEAVKNAVKNFAADLKKDVLAEEIVIGAFEGGKEVEANGEKLFIKISKT